jgi:hypothetical protein
MGKNYYISPSSLVLTLQSPFCPRSLSPGFKCFLKCFSVLPSGSTQEGINSVKNGRLLVLLSCRLTSLLNSTVLVSSSYFSNERYSVKNINLYFSIAYLLIPNLCALIVYKLSPDLNSHLALGPLCTRKPEPDNIVRGRTREKDVKTGLERVDSFAYWVSVCNSK